MGIVGGALAGTGGADCTVLVGTAMGFEGAALVGKIRPDGAVILVGIAAVEVGRVGDTAPMEGAAFVGDI